MPSVKSSHNILHKRIASTLSLQKLPYDHCDSAKSVREQEQVSEISLARSSSNSISSHSSFEADDDSKGRGMYKIGKQDIDRHKIDLIRKEPYSLVR